MIYTHDLLMLIVEVAINIAAFYLGFNAAKERHLYGNQIRKVEKLRVVITILFLILISIVVLIIDILTR